MKLKNTLSFILVASLFISFNSCEEFLDELPDNRAELDSIEKIEQLLVTAYSNRSYNRMCELASDNIDDMGEDNPLGDELLHQNAYWEDMDRASNDSNVNVWQLYYGAISTANIALQAIEELGTPPEALPAKGEALISRAYAHFCLTMLYCLPYHPEKSLEYLGIPYMDKPETQLNPEYERGNLKEVYEKINRDIEEGLPLINDKIYSVPKYHFNKKAAYAFAARFNLYYMRWNKVVEYATLVLGSNPSLVLRDWEATNNLAWGAARLQDYIDPVHEFSLLMIPAVSNASALFYAWNNTGSRYAHNIRVARQETYYAKRPMGGEINKGQVQRHEPYIWLANTHNKLYMPKSPVQWRTTDPVTNAGYLVTTLIPLTTNEALLSRAEAYVHLKQYDKAVQDLETWNQSFYKVGEHGVVSLTSDRINEVYGNSASPDYIPEYTSEVPTSRKKLNPHGFTVEVGEQENFIQCVLFCRRVETVGDGLRWGDIKRYGIAVDRFDNTNYSDATVRGYRISDTLDEKDLRRALQIPNQVISAGLEANPRNKDYPGHPFRQ